MQENCITSRTSSTLANRHQLLQAYLGAGFLFPAQVIVDKGIEFHVDSYIGQIKNCVENFHFQQETTVAVHSVTVKGTTYKQGMFVTVDNSADGVAFNSRIELILVHCNSAVYIMP